MSASTFHCWPDTLFSIHRCRIIRRCWPMCHPKLTINLAHWIIRYVLVSNRRSLLKNTESTRSSFSGSCILYFEVCTALNLWQMCISCAGGVFQELVNNLAMVSIENKFGETPLDRSEASLAQTLQGCWSLFCFVMNCVYCIYCIIHAHFNISNTVCTFSHKNMFWKSVCYIPCVE